MRSSLAVVPLALALGCSGGGGRAPGRPDGGAEASAEADEAGDDADAGSPVDVGPEVPFVPAPHPELPQVRTAGGPVLVTPKVQPILYAYDTASPDILAFLQELARAPYWATVTGEYGVGPLTVLPPIMISTAPPRVTSDADLRAQLVASTANVNSPWGAADPSVIYLYVIPPSAAVTVQNATCCEALGGYHSDVRSGAVTVPYAVTCSCPGFLGITVNPFDERTTVISHELVEAATDPFPNDHPAYIQLDDTDIVWGLINGVTTGGEVADMCEFNSDAHVILPGTSYMVQRSWSNAAARKMDNPCVPYPPGPLYFNSFPALDTIRYGQVQTKGLKIPLGESRTIDVNLYSNAPTKGPWSVKAYDYTSWFFGGKPKLQLSFDKGSGGNGDTLHLTITPVAADADLQGEVFILRSQLGGTIREPDYQTNVTAGLIVN